MAEFKEAEKEQKVVGVLAEVASLVKDSTAEVRKRFVNMLVEKEVSDRVNILDKAIQKRFAAMNDLKKVNRPDNETFDAEGKVLSQSYSKAKLEEIKKAKEGLARVENAIEKALEGDWSKIKEVAGKE